MFSGKRINRRPEIVLGIVKLKMSGGKSLLRRVVEVEMVGPSVWDGSCMRKQVRLSGQECIREESS